MKITVTIVDEALWLAFRKACLDHKTSAGKEIEPLIRKRLAQWEAKKDTLDE